MKKALAIAILTIIGAITLRAQNEYRITQELPPDIDIINICSGWQVRLYQSDQASLTIVTPCQAFYDDANEPEVCTVDGTELTLLENNSLPKSTIIEICIVEPIRRLEIGSSSYVITGNLLFSKHSIVDVKQSQPDYNASDKTIPKTEVTGKTWNCEGSLTINVEYESRLTLDSLIAQGDLWVKVYSKAHFECPELLSPNTMIKKDIKSTGTEFQTDSTINVNVKIQNRNWMRYFDALTISGGISAPIPLYMNNSSGSAYNRGENYRITMMMSVTSGIPLANRMTFKPSLILEFDWSRLLNSVSTNGTSLMLDNSFGAERPQQHLYKESLGLNLSINYRLGKYNEAQNSHPWGVSFGLSLLYSNKSNRLVTRTMGTDDHWHRTRDKVDIFNPWQLRAHVSIGGGPLTRATLGLTYDLLPTFRSGIGADKLHTLGITISF